MVADWHALMSEYKDPSHMMTYIMEMVADWLAVGIDPKKSTIFIQSHVKEHIELFVILSNMVPLSWLERCPTYKEQLREIKTRDLTTYAFLGYPVLQAADILAYKASVVPIGVDQAAHLELTREIARCFNNMHKKIFLEPKTLLTDVPKLLGTDNRKMSKSYNNFIAIGDSEDVIRKKICSMITDPKRIKLLDKGDPDICNVFSYYKIFAKDLRQEAENWCKTAKLGCTECKNRLADKVIEYLSPYRRKRTSLLKDKGYLEDILKLGMQKASEISSLTISEVRKAMGIR
jgi:tryptophanyl-tRNA synthetase